MSTGSAYGEAWAPQAERRSPVRTQGLPVPTRTVAAREVGELHATIAALVDAVDRLERVVATLAPVAESPAVPHPGPSPLTRRQVEVLRLLAAGRSTDDVAAELFLSRPTVRNHVARTLRALGAHTRLEAVAIARDRGLL